jgi:plastocyanin
MAVGHLLAAVAVIAACSDNGLVLPQAPSSPPPRGHSTTILVLDNSFRPSSDTMPAGTVTFQWSMGATLHNVTWTSGPGTLPTNSGNNAYPNTYQATLQKGIYTYICTIHGASMSGLIVVQ